MDVLWVIVVGITGAAVAKRLRISPPLFLVVVGLAISATPWLPDYRLEPEVVLYGVLPPLLFSAALESSYIQFKQLLRPISYLSVGLVLFTTAVVGFTVYWIVPDVGLAAAFALGAIVAPPDAVAATAIGRSLGLPRKILGLLAGESLVNDATALTAYRVAVAAAMGGTFELLDGLQIFLLAGVGGCVLGLAFGYVGCRLIKWLRAPVIENAVYVTLPFVAYALAELVHASGVLAVVVAGLYLGQQSSKMSYATRLLGESVFQTINFVLESAVFLLIGLQFTSVIEDLRGRSVSEVAVLSAVTLLVVIVSRFVWVFAIKYFPWLISRRRRKEPPPSWRAVIVISWAGMRGVVSLAAAFALPVATTDVSAFPARDLILFVTFVVTVGTLIIQGLTLPWMIRKLNVVGAESQSDALAEASAQHAAAQAALARLEEQVTQGGVSQAAEEVVSHLRQQTELRSLAAWERLGPQGPDRLETPAETYRRLRREMLSVERQIFVNRRDAGDIDDEVLRRVQRELDLEEAMIARD